MSDALIMYPNNNIVNDLDYLEDLNSQAVKKAVHDEFTLSEREHRRRKAIRNVVIIVIVLVSCVVMFIVWRKFIRKAETRVGEFIRHPVKELMAVGLGKTPEQLNQEFESSHLYNDINAGFKQGSSSSETEPWVELQPTATRNVGEIHQLSPVEMACLFVVKDGALRLNYENVTVNANGINAMRNIGFDMTVNDCLAILIYNNDCKSCEYAYKEIKSICEDFDVRYADNKRSRLIFAMIKASDVPVYMHQYLQQMVPSFIIYNPRIGKVSTVMINDPSKLKNQFEEMRRICII